MRDELAEATPWLQEAAGGMPASLGTDHTFSTFYGGNLASGLAVAAVRAGEGGAAVAALEETTAACKAHVMFGAEEHAFRRWLDAELKADPVDELGDALSRASASGGDYGQLQWLLRRARDMSSYYILITGRLCSRSRRRPTAWRP